MIKILIITSMIALTVQAKENTKQKKESKKLKLEEFISEKEIIKNIKTYRGKIPRNFGYKNRKIRSTLISYAAKNRDKSLFKDFMKEIYANRNKQSEFRQEMLDFFDLNPSFFLGEFHKIYPKKNKCFGWFFNTESFLLDSSLFETLAKKHKSYQSEILEATSKTLKKDKFKCQDLRNKFISKS